jgi:hypothetical protein
MTQICLPPHPAAAASPAKPAKPAKSSPLNFISTSSMFSCSSCARFVVAAVLWKVAFPRSFHLLLFALPSLLRPPTWRKLFAAHSSWLPFCSAALTPAGDPCTEVERVTTCACKYALTVGDRPRLPPPALPAVLSSILGIASKWCSSRA